MSASAKVEIVIKDACILFDLLDLNLLECFYQLKIVVVTTPEVLDEIMDEDQLRKILPFIENGNLQLDGQGVFSVVESIVESNPGLSYTDAAVLEVASRRQATVLSSDKSLRNESQRRGLAVKGLLWVIEELFNEQIISKEAALEKLALYPEVNKRAPKIEITNLITKIQQAGEQE